MNVGVLCCSCFVTLALARPSTPRAAAGVPAASSNVAATNTIWIVLCLLTDDLHMDNETATLNCRPESVRSRPHVVGVRLLLRLHQLLENFEHIGIEHATGLALHDVERLLR